MVLVLVDQGVLLLLLLQMVELLLLLLVVLLMLLLLRRRRPLLLMLRRGQFPRPTEIPHGVVLAPLLGLLRLLLLLRRLQRVDHQRNLLTHHCPRPAIHAVVRNALRIIALQRGRQRMRASERAQRVSNEST